jgi:hypothetical protein
MHLKGRGCRPDLYDSRYSPVAGSCEHRNEISDCIKGGEYLDYLIHYQFLNKYCALWS